MTAIEILVITLKDGGLSVNPYKGGKHPRKGYMVSLKGSEVQVSLNEDAPHLEKAINNFVEDNKKILSNSNELYVGTWLDNGLLYIDLSYNVEDRQEAITTGKIYGQLAIYDVVNKKTIYLK